MRIRFIRFLLKIIIYDASLVMKKLRSEEGILSYGKNKM